ncbi:uncharacterized protein LOC121244316 [Juglans microcarpa x Juglans regia]|uniref:uncharacterized protein LOC121244316 n=1 Tax=Juglans microcarpa x Juglans regia TaxID=2249226 RepID=UPI001B7F7085|nr:uncharacterized protein LOC121244316 [Juglans microcarpa x Juglans regia]
MPTSPKTLRLQRNLEGASLREMASTGAAAEGIFRSCLYEGCISGCDTWIERRPYHRNCTCALHKPRNGSSHVVSNNMCKKNVSYPIRRSWSEGSLALHAAASSNHSSPSSSPLLVVGAHAARGPQSSSLFDQDPD